MLRSDLTALSLSEHPSGHLDLPLAPDRSAQAGMAYVILGSRLGLASIMAQEGARIADAHPGCQHLFLRDRRGIDLWRAFLGLLGEGAWVQQEREEMLDAALATFALFDAAAAQAMR